MRFEKTSLVTITGNLSGTYNCALQAKAMVQEEFPEKNIHVIDSWSTGGTLILILKKSASVTDFSEVSPNTNSTIVKSIKFINQSFTQDLPISQIAEASGVTREYFCKLFKKETGQTCISYINELRINRACDLMMQNPNKKIEDISRECGFRTLTYFNRVFKQKLDLSPSEYRHKTLNK